VSVNKVFALYHTISFMSRNIFSFTCNYEENILLMKKLKYKILYTLIMEHNILYNQNFCRYLSINFILKENFSSRKDETRIHPASALRAAEPRSSARGTAPRRTSG
jgi:hypothetical protein